MRQSAENCNENMVTHPLKMQTKYYCVPKGHVYTILSLSDQDLTAKHMDLVAKSSSGSQVYFICIPKNIFFLKGLGRVITVLSV